MPIRAYHVSGNDTIQQVQPNVCDDKERDKRIYGLKAAGFTTTRYEGRLPDFSPYPRSAEAGSDVHRYVMKFDPNEFIKFQMAKTDVKGVSQVHYLLLRESDRNERNLAKFIEACVPDIRDHEWKTYFPGGRANDYANRNHPRAFVNVFFVHAVRVKRTDSVRKRGEPFTLPPVANDSQWYEQMLRRALKNGRTRYVARRLQAMLSPTSENPMVPIAIRDADPNDEDALDAITEGISKLNATGEEEE